MKWKFGFSLKIIKIGLTVLFNKNIEIPLLEVLVGRGERGKKNTTQTACQR